MLDVAVKYGNWAKQHRNEVRVDAYFTKMDIYVIFIILFKRNVTRLVRIVNPPLVLMLLL